MSIINKLIFVVNENNDYVPQSIPSGKITANDINSNFIYLISPADIRTVIKVNFQDEYQNTSPVSVPMRFVGGDITVGELVPKTAPYYDLVKDWNVFNSGIRADVIEKISFNRAGIIKISFSFTTLIIPEAPNDINYIGEINDIDFIPDDEGYYIVKLPRYQIQDIDFGFNDILVKTDDVIERISAIGIRKNANTTNYLIDPSIKEEDFDGIELSIIDNILASISDIYNKIDHIEETGGAKDILIGTARVYTTSLPLSGLRTIDGVPLNVGDRVLVVGNGELNGIYIVEEGDWVRELELEPYQVVSIDEGRIYGGSMQKKLVNGTTQMVKKPERAKWEIY